MSDAVEHERMRRDWSSLSKRLQLNDRIMYALAVVVVITLLVTAVAGLKVGAFFGFFTGFYIGLLIAKPKASLPSR
jgi:ABC-type microcin C transport system permease subunit YejE